MAGAHPLQGVSGAEAGRVRLKARFRAAITVSEGCAFLRFGTLLQLDLESLAVPGAISFHGLPNWRSSGSSTSESGT